MKGKKFKNIQKATIHTRKRKINQNNLCEDFAYF